MRRLALLAALVATSPAHALLVDRPGENFSDDASTGLLWLDVNVTRNVSYDDVLKSSWYKTGWRYATGEELSALWASNLALTPAPAELTPGVPFYGGKLTDYYAPDQADPTGSTLKLIQTLGGPTSYGDGTFVSIVATIDRTVFCAGLPCHVEAGITAYNDGRAGASIAGAALDNVSGHFFGNFLVTAIPPAVPEPETWLMMLAGLAGLIGSSFTFRMSGKPSRAR